jgi:UPF0716 protein FxsA
MWLFALFVAVPILEIALFIQVGGWLGLWPTLLIVVLTALLGTVLVRQQGLEQLRRIQGSLDRFSDPTEPLAHGAMILVAGVLLLTPGFFTDAVGFALLVPGLRRAALAWARERIAARVVAAGAGGTRPGPAGAPRGRGRPDVLEGEWSEVEEPGRRPAEPPIERARDGGPSKWTRDP